VRVIARIQGHPSRTHLHEPLKQALELSAEVSIHESEPPSPWDGYRVCLSDLPDCSHLLVIQDDAVPCRNFGSAVEQIAARHPSTPVCLFLARLPRRTSRDATLALKAGQRYVPLFIRDFCPVVAMLWPKEKAEEFMFWARDARLPGQPNPRSDDAVVGRWMLMTKQTILVTVPSLVQHPDMEPSLIGRRPAWGKDSGRVALHFAEDALSYEW